MASLASTNTFQKNVDVFATAISPEMDQKIGKEINEGAPTRVKKSALAKIPEFWVAKYRCILMGVILFFSILEIIMFNVNNFLQGESTKSILQKLIRKYFYENRTVT